MTTEATEAATPSSAPTRHAQPTCNQLHPSRLVRCQRAEWHLGAHFGLERGKWGVRAVEWTKDAQR